MSVSTKQSAKTSHVKSTVLQKNGGRQRNLDPCSETLRTCLAEKCLRLLLSVPCGPFSWEDNTSASDCDCVRPVLLYNAGTWGLAGSETDKLNAFHRKQLHLLIGIKWPQRISNSNLYERCGCHEISTDVMDM